MEFSPRRTTCHFCETHGLTTTLTSCFTQQQAAVSFRCKACLDVVDDVVCSSIPSCIQTSPCRSPQTHNSQESRCLSQPDSTVLCSILGNLDQPPDRDCASQTKFTHFIHTLQQVTTHYQIATTILQAVLHIDRQHVVDGLLVTSVKVTSHTSPALPHYRRLSTLLPFLRPRDWRPEEDVWRNGGQVLLRTVQTPKAWTH
jgi:hypothetical protein